MQSLPYPSTPTGITPNVCVVTIDTVALSFDEKYNSVITIVADSDPEQAEVYSDNLAVFDDAAIGNGKVEEQVITLTFTATGTVGVELASIVLTSTATLTLNNLCFDPTIVSFTVNEEMPRLFYTIPISATTPPTEYCCYDDSDGQYTLNVPGTDPEICGPVKIEFFYNGSTDAITATSEPLSFKDGTEPYTLQILNIDYTLDFSLFYPYVRELTLEDYPTVLN